MGCYLNPLIFLKIKPRNLCFRILDYGLFEIKKGNLHKSNVQKYISINMYIYVCLFYSLECRLLSLSVHILYIGVQSQILPLKLKALDKFYIFT